MSIGTTTDTGKTGRVASPLKRLVSCGIYRPCKETATLYIQLNLSKSTVRFGFWFKGKRNLGFSRSDFKSCWWFEPGSIELDLWRFSYAKVLYFFEDKHARQI